MNFVNELESVKRVIGAINDMSTANDDVKALHDHIEYSEENTNDNDEVRRLTTRMQNMQKEFGRGKEQSDLRLEHAKAQNEVIKKELNALKSRNVAMKDQVFFCVLLFVSSIFHFYFCFCFFVCFVLFFFP